jgi:hypothetical protein
MWWKIAGLVERGIRASCSCSYLGKGYTSEYRVLIHITVQKRESVRNFFRNIYSRGTRASKEYKGMLGLYRTVEVFVVATAKICC